jgi:L-iditol 2-dehydrogenase
MKAAVYREKGSFSIEDVPRPSLESGEMLVKVDVCGMCGTDIKKVQKGLLAGPRIFGHEIAGTVERVAPGVTRFREGDRVALHHHIPCGQCFYCREQAYAQCPRYKENGTTAGFEPSGGGMAEYVKARDYIVERGAIPIPDGVRPEEAAFVEPVNTCLKAVRKAHIQAGMTVLVVGQGPIGLLLMQLARREGSQVIASDTMADRLEMSRRLGAAATLDAGAVDVVGEVRAATSGRGADRTLLAALGPVAVRQAIDATRAAGKVVVFSATSPGETAEIDLGALCASEKDILTSYSASVDVQDEAARVVFGREVRVQELVTHRLPLAQANEAMALAARPAPGVLKVVIEMGR